MTGTQIIIATYLWNIVVAKHGELSEILCYPIWSFVGWLAKSLAVKTMEPTTTSKFDPERTNIQLDRFRQRLTTLSYGLLLHSCRIVASNSSRNATTLHADAGANVNQKLLGAPNMNR